MNLLAIETATEACSAALLSGDRLWVRSELAPRRHAELLLAMCESLLDEAGLARTALDAIAVGCGPGAFTGVRLAISAAQGIALAIDIPVVTVSSLAALAMQAPADAQSVLAVIDARMGEVYAGVYARTADGLVALQGAETVGAAAKLDVPRASALHVIGSGWATYRDVIEARLGAAPAWADGARYPLADAVATLGRARLLGGHAVSAEHALPVYLRDNVALTLVEQQARRAEATGAG